MQGLQDDFPCLSLYEDTFPSNRATGSRAFTSRATIDLYSVHDVGDSDDEASSPKQSILHSHISPSLGHSSCSVEKSMGKGKRLSPQVQMVKCLQELVEQVKKDHIPQQTISPLTLCQKILEELGLDTPTYIYALHYLRCNLVDQQLFVNMEPHWCQQWLEIMLRSRPSGLLHRHTFPKDPPILALFSSGCLCFILVVILLIFD